MTFFYICSIIISPLKTLGGVKMMDQETKSSICYWVKLGLFLLVVGVVAVACFASTRWQAAEKAINGVNYAVIQMKDDEAADPRSLTESVISVAVRGDHWSLFWPEAPSYEEQAERALILAFLKNGWPTEAERIASNSRFFASAVEVARDEAKAILSNS